MNQELKAFLLQNFYHHPRGHPHGVQGQSHAHRDLPGVPWRNPGSCRGRCRSAFRQGPDSLERVICDYIAGMTDRYAILEYKRLFDPEAKGLIGSLKLACCNSIQAFKSSGFKPSDTPAAAPAARRTAARRLLVGVFHLFHSAAQQQIVALQLELGARPALRAPRARPPAATAARYPDRRPRSSAPGRVSGSLLSHSQACSAAA